MSPDSTVLKIVPVITHGIPSIRNPPILYPIAAIMLGTKTSEVTAANDPDRLIKIQSMASLTFSEEMPVSCSEVRMYKVSFCMAMSSPDRASPVLDLV